MADEAKKVKKIEIKVNNNPVVMDEKKVTGLEIKQAAVNQGVDIQIDFHLSMEKENGGWRRIDNDTEVTLSEKHRVFRAVQGDENS